MAETSLKTLILEDDPDLAMLLSLALMRRGYDCAVASTLAQGRALLDEQCFAYVILDLVLPDGSGTELLSALPLGASRDAVVIVSSGNVTDTTKADRRIDHVFCKPYELDALLDCMGAAR